MRVDFKDGVPVGPYKYLQDPFLPAKHWFNTTTLNKLRKRANRANQNLKWVFL